MTRRLSTLTSTTVVFSIVSPRLGSLRRRRSNHVSRSINHAHAHPLPGWLVLSPYILVFIGGTVGTFLRILLGAVPGNSEIPWVTFAINISGASFLGALYGLTSRFPASASTPTHLRLLLGTGLLGGYTTYSTLAVGTDGLILGDRLLLGAAYAIPTVVLGILSAFLAEGACHTRTVPAVRS